MGGVIARKKRKGSPVEYPSSSSSIARGGGTAANNSGSTSRRQSPKNTNATSNIQETISQVGIKTFLKKFINSMEKSGDREYAMEKPTGKRGISADESSFSHSNESTKSVSRIGSANQSRSQTVNTWDTQGNKEDFLKPLSFGRKSSSKIKESKNLPHTLWEDCCVPIKVCVSGEELLPTYHVPEKKIREKELSTNGKSRSMWKSSQERPPTPRISTTRVREPKTDHIKDVVKRREILDERIDTESSFGSTKPRCTSTPPTPTTPTLSFASLTEELKQSSIKGTELLKFGRKHDGKSKKLRSNVGTLSADMSLLHGNLSKDSVASSKGYGKYTSDFSSEFLPTSSSEGGTDRETVVLYSQSNCDGYASPDDGPMSFPGCREYLLNPTKKERKGDENDQFAFCIKKLKDTQNWPEFQGDYFPGGLENNLDTGRDLLDVEVPTENCSELTGKNEKRVISNRKITGEKVNLLVPHENETTKGREPSGNHTRKTDVVEVCNTQSPTVPANIEADKLLTQGREIRENIEKNKNLDVKSKKELGTSKEEKRRSAKLPSPQTLTRNIPRAASNERKSIPITSNSRSPQLSNPRSSQNSGNKASRFPKENVEKQSDKGNPISRFSVPRGNVHLDVNISSIDKSKQKNPTARKSPFPDKQFNKENLSKCLPRRGNIVTDSNREQANRNKSPIHKGKGSEKPVWIPAGKKANALLETPTYNKYNTRSSAPGKVSAKSPNENMRENTLLTSQKLGLKKDESKRKGPYMIENASKRENAKKITPKNPNVIRREVASAKTRQEQQNNCFQITMDSMESFQNLRSELRKSKSAMLKEEMAYFHPSLIRDKIVKDVGKEIKVSNDGVNVNISEEMLLGGKHTCLSKTRVMNESKEHTKITDTLSKSRPSSQKGDTFVGPSPLATFFEKISSSNRSQGHSSPRRKENPIANIETVKRNKVAPHSTTKDKINPILEKARTNRIQAPRNIQIRKKLYGTDSRIAIPKPNHQGSVARLSVIQKEGYGSKASKKPPWRHFSRPNDNFGTGKGVNKKTEKKPNKTDFRNRKREDKPTKETQATLKQKGITTKGSGWKQKSEMWYQPLNVQVILPDSGQVSKPMITSEGQRKSAGSQKCPPQDCLNLPTKFHSGMGGRSVQPDVKLVITQRGHPNSTANPGGPFPVIGYYDSPMGYRKAVALNVHSYETRTTVVGNLVADCMESIEDDHTAPKKKQSSGPAGKKNTIFCRCKSGHHNDDSCPHALQELESNSPQRSLVLAGKNQTLHEPTNFFISNSELRGYPSSEED